MNNLIIQLIINLVILILGINLGALFTLNLQAYFDYQDMKRKQEEAAIRKAEKAMEELFG